MAAERAFLIAAFDDDCAEDRRRSLIELALLTETAGSDPIESELVRRPLPDPATFIGSGKARELAGVTGSLDIDVVVFDNSLTPAQQRNLQEIFECDVVDREALILDIFAQHARPAGKECCRWNLPFCGITSPDCTARAPN